MSQKTAPGSVMQRLDNMPLKRKLYIGLGVLIGALFLSAGLATLSSLATQRLVSQTLVRQRRLADLAANINSNLLNIQNQAFEFYETWTLTGFETEVGSGGFRRARESDLDPILAQLDRIRADIDVLQQQDPGPQTASNLAKILTNLDAYETTLIAMSDQMEGLGYRDTGEFGQLQQIITRLEKKLENTDLDVLSATVARIDRYSKGFFLRSELPYVRMAREAMLELKFQINTADEAQLPPTAKDALNEILERYYDHFLSAANIHRRLQDSRTNLVSQSNLTSSLVQQLFEQQQTDFSASVARLQRQQSNTITITLGLAVFISIGSVIVAYYVTGRIIRPVQTLGDAAARLGAGDLSVRAVIQGTDEIGATGRAFNLMADRLQASLSEMERRVADRTRELETITAELAGRSAELEEAHARQLQVNRQLEEAVGQSQRRALLLQASTEVSRAMAQIRDMDRLLSQVTQLISERFNVYHCGIFLIDPANRCAVLRAANSDGGQRLVAQQHKLGVGSEGIVGYVTDTGQHRIALDVGEDAFFFNNPELPDTRSELACPLRVGDKIIGALDVQSVEQAAFEDEDVAVLTSLADQIAIAIENARLFQQSRTALEEARRAQQRYVQQQWLEYTRQQTALAYEYTLSGVNPVDAAPGPEIREAWQDGRLVTLDSDGRLENTANGNNGNPSRATLAVPVQVHGEPIGLLELQESDGEHMWTDDEIALVQAVADQLGQTLESARLFEQMQASLAETQTLFQTSRSLAAAQEIEDVWQAITDAARQRNIDACGLFLFDSRQRETAREIILVAGWDERQPPRLNVGIRLPIGGLDVFDTMHLDRPFTVTDLTQAASIDEDTHNLLDALGVTAALLQPIALRGRWFGLLAVLYRSRHEFTSAESDFFRTLTDQAALAFEGQRLLAETQRRAQREQLIRQITDKVRATSDLDTILQTTVQELSNAMGLPRAFVRLGVQEDMAPSHSVETARSGPASPPAEGITDE